MEQRVPVSVLTGPLSFARRLARPLVKRTPTFTQRLTQRMRQIQKSPLFRPIAALGFLGPGLIATTAGNDAGGIATYATVGAQYGYGLLWMMVVITVCMAVVQEMCTRMGVATGKGLSDLIRERFGVRGAAFAMLTLLVANMLVTISEFAGIAAASELFGISKYITVPIAAVGIWFITTRGSYGRVEKIFLAMTLVFLGYPIAAVLARPDWGQVVAQTVIPSFHLTSTYLLLFVGTVGTTITPYMQVYVQSSVAEKKLDMAHYGAERADAYVGAIFSDAISALIIIATGATLFVSSHGKGVPISDAAQAARALEPLAGKYAFILFAVGLLGASLLAAAVVPLSTSYAICESFGFERGVSFRVREAPIFHGIYMGMLTIGALVALIPGLPLIELIIVAQVINGVLLPILLVYILLLVNDRRIMGKHVNGPINNVIAWGTAGMLTVLSAWMIASIILPPLGIPFMQ
ncbi:MAG TPA: Nramp family divalent metal transporter [Ktedonobacterales bacterium]|nr:Nramp family divalent metal transporter [Ktedonobacterales bacterium]